MAAPEAHMLRSVAVTLCRDGRLRISRELLGCISLCTYAAAGPPLVQGCTVTSYWGALPSALEYHLEPSI